MGSFSDKVTQSMVSLTHTQRIVADYVLEHLDAMAFATLDSVALKIGVSTTTIIRFSRMMGYSGYSEMQRDIQSEIMDKVSLPERFNNTRTSSGLDKLLEETVKNDISNITETVNHLPEGTLRQVVDEIQDARQLYVLGMRSSFALAHYTTSRLGQIRSDVRLIQSVGMIFPEELVGVGPQDRCIAFLFPRYSKTTANLLMWLKDRGVRVILFTSTNYSRVQNYGDIFVPCCVKGNSFKNSFTAPMCLINYIAATVALESGTALEILQQTEEFLSKGYYLGL